jgi:hypothetical protein
LSIILKTPFKSLNLKNKALPPPKGYPSGRKLYSSEVLNEFLHSRPPLFAADPQIWKNKALPPLKDYIRL